MSDPILVTATGDATRTRAMLRARAYRLTSRGVRLPASAEDLVACTRAALAPLTTMAVVCGPTAALLHDLPLPSGMLDDPRIHVLVSRDFARPRRRDISAHRGPIGELETDMVEGLVVTNPARTFVDLAKWLNLPDLVAVGDVILARGVDPADIRSVIDIRRSFPGRSRAIRAVDWLDGAAESPPESRLRVHLRAAGLPKPRVNGLILDSVGNVVARGDLVFDEAMLIVEYDGAVHLTPVQQHRDALRRAELQALGWMVLELNRLDLANPRRAVVRVRSALRARGVDC